MIPYGRQNITQDDIDAVVQALKSDFITQGPAVAAFEKSVAAYCGAPYATAVCNATAALHIAYLAAGLAPGDILWTSPNTFAATANAALLCGAQVDFVDIDPRTYNLSVERLAEKLAQAKLSGHLPKIVVPVHFSGQPAAMAEIRQLADQYDFIIIEDAAHAIGAEYKGAKIGSCQYSDMCIFSFHPVKIITTGEGGMIMTKSKTLHDKLQLLRTHGITRDRTEFTRQDQGSWYAEQIALGNNYRITDLQAALGNSQMQRIDTFLEKRRSLAARYSAEFSDLNIQLPSLSNDALSSWHLYVIQVPENLSRRECFDRLKELGLGVNVHYIPVHYHPYYQSKGFKPGLTPEAERYYERTITLPLYPDLSEEQITRVISSVRQVFS